MPINVVPYELGGYLVVPRTTPVSFLTGVVLAGGKSSRMGQDKASMRLDDSGPNANTSDKPTLAYAMADMLHDALQAQGPHAEIWISCQADRIIPLSHSRLGRVHDSVQDVGPLAGIIAALQVAKGPIFVVACDMPLMQSDILHMLMKERQKVLHDPARRHPVLMTCFQNLQKACGGKPSIEPLVAIYEYAALPYLEEALQKKHFSLRRIIDQEALCVVPYSEKQKEFFFNMNNVFDYKEATQLLLRHKMEA